VVYLGLEDAIQSSTSFACFPRVRFGARRQMWCTPYRTLQLLPPAAALQCELKVFRGCGTPQLQKFRVALDNRNALRGKRFSKVVRLGRCDPDQQLLRLPSPRSARGSEKDVVHPMLHFAASARCRSLQV
jgi:hypothetical protein